MIQKSGFLIKVPETRIDLLTGRKLGNFFIALAGFTKFLTSCVTTRTHCIHIVSEILIILIGTWGSYMQYVPNLRTYIIHSHELLFGTKVKVN